MAVTGVTMKPTVVELGGAYEEMTRSADGVDTITEGDLIRINVADKYDLAEASSAGAIHAIALEDGVADTPLRALILADDTVLAIQCVDTVAPEDLTIGSSYTLEYSAGKHGITTTTSNGVLFYIGVPGTTQPWSIEYGGWGHDVTANNDVVLVRIKQTTLDTYAAAAT